MNWWLWEQEEDRNKRQAEDFKKAAEQRASQEDASLFERSAGSILDNLYGAAERGMGALDSLRSGAMEQAQDFGEWASDRLEDVGTGASRGIERSLSTPSSLLQDLPSELGRRVAEPFTGAEASQRFDERQAQRDQDDPVKRAINFLNNAATGQVVADVGNEVASQFGVPKANVPVLGEVGVGDVASMWQPGGVFGKAGNAGKAASEAAERVASRGDDPVRRALGMLGLADAPATRAGIVDQADDAGRAMDRYYHGTGSDFARPDPGKFDPNGLFGPGYYVTDDARVAGDYGRQRNPGVRNVQSMLDDLSEHDRRLGNPEGLSKSDIERLKNSKRSLEYQIDTYGAQLPPEGPNIRPVDVPRDLKLLDADAEVADDVLGAVQGAIAKIESPEAADKWRQTWDYRSRIYNSDAVALQDSLIGIGSDTPLQGNKELANRVLAQAGYDGIRYAGGKRIPMKDEAGEAIEHTALVIFPESLDKIRNATAGTAGGFLPSATRHDVANIGSVAVRGATQGAIAGGYEASRQEDADVGDVAMGALQGAGIGIANKGLHALGIRPRSGSTIMQAVKSYGPSDEKIAGSITPPAQPASDVLRELPDKVVRQLFDNTIPLRRVGEAVEALRGSKLGFSESAHNLLRLARGSSAAADQALEDALGPVLKGTDDQTLSDLNRYLKAKDAIDKDAVSPGHNFGGATAADAQQALQEMQAALGPQKMAELDAKAKQVWQFGHDLLKRKLDAGLIDQGLYQDLVTKFPHYSPIRIIDWIDDEMARGSGGMGASNRLNVTATGLKRLTEAGTDRAAEAPLDAYVRLAHETYRRSMMNEAAAAMINHLGELSHDPAWAKLITPADTDAAKLLGYTGPIPSRAPGQVGFHAFVNGQKYDFWLDKPLEQAINFTVPNLQKDFATNLLFDIPAKMVRAGATSANALFLIPNVIGDTMTYLIRNGGLANLPETLPSLAKGWKSAIKKDAAYSDFRLAGGGHSGFFGAEAGAGSKTINDLRGINNMVKTVLGVVPRAGERVEAATRLAEYHRMLAKGASKQEAALGARDVTIDFARGGEFTKRANAFIPFFNVGFQAPAQVARLMQNPATRGRALTGVMSTVVAPTIGLELYNRQDPTYADVPQYDKDRGLVIMSPWGPGPVSPETGRPTPRYFLLALREWSPFAIAVRESMAAALGEDKNAWDVARRTITSASPIEPSAKMIGDVLPPLPKQAIEQLTNYDTFRDRPIVPEGLQRLPNEQQYTSETSEVAKLAGKLTGQSPLRIQHAVTGLGAGVARQALAAGDMALKGVGVTPEPSRRIQQLERELARTGLSEEKAAVLRHELEVERSKEMARTSSVKNTPLVGGLASTLYREQGGEIDRRTGQSIDQRLTALRSDKDPTGKELQRLGITFSDVDNKIGERILSRSQTAQYRTRALDYREALLSELMTTPAYRNADDKAKARMVSNAMTRAAAWASQEVLPGANENGREFLTAARGNIDTAVNGYVKAVAAQREIDNLKDTRYLGYSGDDASEIATDRALLSNLRNVSSSTEAGDAAFISRYGARRYARARYARVNPMYTAKIDQIERSSPELMTYLRANPIVRELPAAV